MFKSTRLLAALALCLAFVLCASCAVAAPKLKLSVPAKEVPSGETYEITVNATEPGFVTVTLSQNGILVDTIFANKEIHTTNNDLSADALDAQDQLLTPGVYTVTASMVDQFGASSGEVSKDMTVGEAPVVEEVVEEPVVGTDVTNSSVAAPAAAPAATAAPTPVPEVLTYQPGVTSIGAEGFEIGVGVSDSAATAKGAWAITSQSTDAEIWAALQQPLVSSNVDEREYAYIYNTTADGRKRLGTISGFAQGVNVVKELDNGWSLVEAYRSEDGAFVRGYMRTKNLRTVTPNPTFGLVIDKATQTLIVYKEGVRIGSCLVSTGLPTFKYPHRETPAGEFIAATRRGTTEYYGSGYSKYTIRMNGSYHLSEIPTTKKNGSDFSMLAGSLGNKVTRGNICIAHDTSADGGINAEWIWNISDEYRYMKVLILDDKDRSSVPVTE